MQVDNWKVGIILVNYNGYTVTKDCLDSLSKSKGNFKVYVVDNASTDGSYEKVLAYVIQKKYNNMEVIENKSNTGFAGGNNIAIKLAFEQGADYVILLNNDTVVERDFIQYLIEPFEKHRDCYASVSKIYYESNRKRIWYAGGAFSYKTGKVMHWRYGEEEDGREENIEKVTFATGCCLCISKECFDNIGLLSEEYFLYDEDTDYCLRILEKNKCIYYTPKSIIYHKVNASTKKKKGLIDYYMTRNRIIVISKFIKKKRLIAYFTSMLTYMYRCLKGQMSFIYFFKGIIGAVRFNR